MLESIYEVKKGIISKRVSSYDRTGGNNDFVVVAAGETACIADIPDSGIIRHIWMTLDCKDPMIRRNAILRMYWDGEAHPSVQSPLGDFFGQGWGEEYSFLSLPLCSGPAKGKSLVCYFPMPFGQGARIELENQSDIPITSLYYYVDYEVRGDIDDKMGRFHAWWNRDLTSVTPDQGEAEWGLIAPHEPHPSNQNNYSFAHIRGEGRFVGLHYYVDNPGPIWYGEGDDMWNIDGEAWPGSLHGTGTEDFFNGAWCPNEVYMHPYFGFAKVPNALGWMGRTHCYRFFLEDPIYFSKSLEAGIEHGHNNSLTLDISTVAFWYQTEPHLAYPVFPAKEARQNLPAIGVKDVHLWRHAFRKSLGNERTIWGNELQK